ncbi:MAG: hypothetical protein LBL47_03745 [Lactobacillus sp.]|jgi:response regulator RpfG family c-di-GMP phosphodiesterase|nr:hypothetical protein [Lactobacillus sp.]
MSLITDNRYYKPLKDTYFRDAYQNSPSEYYKEWMAHKFTHSMKVSDAGARIIEMTPELYSLDEKVKDEFISALILHDLGRAFERDSITSEMIKIDHGTRGAQELVKWGEKSLNIIIPVMLHNKFNEGFVTYTDEELKAEREYHWLKDEEREFVNEYRAKFLALGENEKKNVIAGLYLVKDADKIDNLINANDMIVLNRAPKEPVVSDEVIRQFYGGQMVRLDARINFIDHVFCWISWIHDIRFEASKEILRQEKALDSMKANVIRAHQNISAEQIKYMEDVLDKAISFILP